MKIKIHTKGITGSSVIKEGEEPGALFGALIEIDGALFDLVTDVKVEMGDEFATVTATFVPSSVEIVPHTNESWAKIAGEADYQRANAKIRRAGGRMIAIFTGGGDEE